MITFVTIIHLLVCLILIVVVLLQTGRGADLAGAFGGSGSQAAIGIRSPASFFSRMTTIAAIMFMVTSMTLAIMKSKKSKGTIMNDEKEQREQLPQKSALPKEQAGGEKNVPNAPATAPEEGGGVNQPAGSAVPPSEARDKGPGTSGAPPPPK
jgi:preprotein translocase subunit SecG